MDPVLVLGGCGALGHHIIKQLLHTKKASEVTAFDIRTDVNRVPGANYIKGSIVSEQDVRSALETVRPKVIIHTISPQLMGQKNTHKLYENVNIGGTKILLDCIAKTNCVKALVYTSSSSVIHNNITDLVEATEEGRLFYWPEQTEFYSHTKAVAEDLIQGANRQNGLLTTRLRGSLLFGEGDTTATPQMIANARTGRTKFQIGDGTNLFDFTYIGNTAYAHILAADALIRESDGRADRDGPLKVNGEAFCITNDDHWPFWDFIREMAAECGHPVPKNKVTVVPTSVYYAFAVVAEWAVWAFSLGSKESNVNRRMVKYLTMTRTFNISKAKERLGYQPQVGIRDGIKRAVQHYLAHECEKKSN
ncbi:hydroxysteroid dehydrogenase [Periconia macrospinosa]|uniref:Hydroxysteroid dehydrogenase n=1 Tax=Periconia macrospinosa TaxID=97972 RepID=A0A2V1DMJ6_9PLEO|nr:hydroxysteroid dehydrogenase [Periconia macrospinosa]